MIIKIKNIIHESLNLYSLIFLRGAKIWLILLNCKSGSIAIITVLIIYISINSKNGEKKHKIAKNYKNVLSLKFAFRSIKMELCCTVIYAFP